MGNFLSCYNFYITICFVLWWRLNLKLHVLPTFCVTRKFFEFYNTVVDMLRFRFFSSTLFSRLFLWSTRNALQQKALLLWSIMGMPGKQAAALFPVNFKVVFCFCFFFLCKCVCLYSFCLLTSRCSPMRDYREIVVVQSD